MNIIAAADKNWGIGNKGNLLTHIKEDMKFFKEHTTGNTIIMGRKTLESLPGSKPLPNRTNVVLTRNCDYNPDGVEVFHSIDEFLKSDINKENVYVIGGESLYRELLPYCDTAYVKKVDATVSNADAFMVDLDSDSGWKVVSESEVFTEKGYDFKFVEYNRI